MVMYQKARKHYEERGIDFNTAFKKCLNEGWVISEPFLFAMGYFYDDGGTVCFIEYCCGDVGDLFRHGLNIEIDKIAFQRNADGKTRIYSFDRIRRLYGVS